MSGKITRQELAEVVREELDSYLGHLGQTTVDDVHGLMSQGKIIEESGSNENGYYVRFADGTQLCSVIHGAQEVTTSNTNYSFPASFSGSSSVAISNIWPVSNEAGRTLARDLLVRTSSSAWIVAHVNNVATLGFTLLAIGRWK